MNDETPTLPTLPDSRAPLSDEHHAQRLVTDGVAALALTGSDGWGDRLWKRYLSALLRHKLLVASVVALGTLAGLAAAYMAKPRYLAEATIWVQSEAHGGQRGTSGPFVGPAVLRSYDWVSLLTSYAVLEDVVRQEGLYLSPQSPRDTSALATLSVLDGFTPGRYALRVSTSGRTYELLSGDSTVVDRAQVGDPIGTRLGIVWTPPRTALHRGQTIAFTLQNPRDAARALKKQLDVRMLQGGHFITLRLEGTQPARLARVVNAIADRFKSVATELQGGHAQQVEAELKSQLDRTHAQLAGADSALEAFQAANATAPLNGTSTSFAAGATNPVLDNYYKLQFERDRVRRDRQALQTLLASRGTRDNVAAFVATIPSAQSWTELTGLTSQLAAKRDTLRILSLRDTNTNPDVRTLKAEIDTLRTRTIPAAVRALVGTLADREAQLDTQIAQAGQRLAAIPPRAAEAARLERTASIDGELYSTLKQRYDEVSLAVDSRVSDVQIVDRAAIGDKPVSDHRLQILILSILASLGLSVFGVLCYDRIDPHIRYPEEVSRGLGIAILGTIPHLKLEDRRHPGRDVAAEAMEAFRGLRLNLSYAYGSAGPLILAITSPGPGEGKSFVAMNLALSFSRAGQRTLLIDGDVRRGRLHRTLQLERRPGLMDHLMDQCGQREVVRRTGYGNLDLVPCGVRKQEAPELLATARLGEMLATFRREYQVVIVDTPPLGTGVDPLILGVATGHLLLVLRAGTSVRGIMEKRMEQFSRLPVRIVGAVMNDVPPMATYPYYYSYLADYTPTEEKADAGTDLVRA